MVKLDEENQNILVYCLYEAQHVTFGRFKLITFQALRGN
jgi:hypothetical protein